MYIGFIRAAQPYMGNIRRELFPIIVAFPEKRVHSCPENFQTPAERAAQQKVSFEHKESPLYFTKI